MKAYVLKQDAFDDLFLEITFLSDELLSFFDLYETNKRYHDGEHCILTVFNGVDKGKTFKVNRNESVLIGRRGEFRQSDLASFTILLDNSYSTVSKVSKPHLKLFYQDLARGKTSIATGELITILTILKAIPYTYNRDLQEITPHLWNAIKVTQDTLSIVTKMLLSVEFKVDRCAELAGKNFATATDLADIMVREKKIPFRTAHKIVGRIVNEATASDMAEEDITSKFIDDIAVELGFDELNLDDDLIQRALNPRENVRIRAVPGGPAPEMVEIARENIKLFLDKEFERHGI